MATNEIKAEFKTLLSEAEYKVLYNQFHDQPSDTQTNYYFDTPRYTLKASDIVLRVKETEKGLSLIVERRKGYDYKKFSEPITQEEFDAIKRGERIINPVIANEINDVIKEQKLNNFMSLSTFRVSLNYKKGKLAIDKCTYLNKVDYELEYVSTTRDAGKMEFIDIIKEFGITYKKTQVKLKRAYEALRTYF